MLLLCTLMVSGTVFVDQYRYDDHRPFDHQLPEIGDAHQRHAVIERGDNQRPYQRAGDGTDPPTKLVPPRITAAMASSS